jgi:hypothetical protein
VARTSVILTLAFRHLLGIFRAFSGI